MTKTKSALLCRARWRAKRAWSRFVHWSVRRLPRIILTDTWQTMLAVLMVGVGMTTLYSQFVGSPTAVSRTLSSTILATLWGLSFVLGGLSQIIGLQTSHVRTERLGIHLCGLASSVLCLVLMGVGTPPAYIYGIAFGFLALSNFIVLFISAAAQPSRGT